MFREPCPRLHQFEQAQGCGLRLCSLCERCIRVGLVSLCRADSPLGTRAFTRRTAFLLDPTGTLSYFKTPFFKHTVNSTIMPLGKMPSISVGRELLNCLASFQMFLSFCYNLLQETVLTSMLMLTQHESMGQNPRSLGKQRGAWVDILQGIQMILTVR